MEVPSCAGEVPHVEVLTGLKELAIAQMSSFGHYAIDVMAPILLEVHDCRGGKVRADRIVGPTVSPARPPLPL